MNIKKTSKKVTEVDLRNINWRWLNAFAKKKPMDVHVMRENIRQQIVAIGDAHNLPQLSAWAAGLSPSALDFLTHIGFLESHFWETLTAPSPENLEPKGFVRFIGHDEKQSDPESGNEVRDGMHRVRNDDQ